MELKELECPFCNSIADWNVAGVEFMDTEVYMKTDCPSCKKELVLAIPLQFARMRMFVTPTNASKVRAEMLPYEEATRVRNSDGKMEETVIPPPKTEELGK